MAMATDITRPDDSAGGATVTRSRLVRTVILAVACLAVLGLTVAITLGGVSRRERPNVALTVMPFGAYSRARALVSPTTPPFDAT